MQHVTHQWDYLIITASSEAQAAGYHAQVTLRRRLGLLSAARDVRVVPDPGDRRVGSGGSTICCLLEVLAAEAQRLGVDLSQPDDWEAALRPLRVLIVHAGGDSRRLPAYGPCGKIFVPVPGENDMSVYQTLFDRQLPTYLALPAPPDDRGQVVITAGDVLLRFDPADVDLSRPGLTALACREDPRQASRHGVFCAESAGQVRRYLQKPTVEQQQQAGAIDRFGQSLLDIGVMHFDAPTARALLECFEVRPDRAGRLGWSGEIGQAVERQGVDFYREVCCALGSEADSAHHVHWARASGSPLTDALLGRVFQAVSSIPFHVHVLGRCEFLHFGTTAQLIDSGQELMALDRGSRRPDGCLMMNNDQAPHATVTGTRAWIEGCRLHAPVRLAGDNVLIGVDVSEPLDLPAGACLDVLHGVDHSGQDVWFVRCYGLDDTFKPSADDGGTLAGRPLGQWLSAVGAADEDVWAPGTAAADKTVWSARLFPACDGPQGYRDWLWMLDPESADDDAKAAWKAADRYSLAEIAGHADQHGFHARRRQTRAEEIRQSLRHMFRPDSGFSAAELAFALSHARDRTAWIAQMLAEARWHYGADDRPSLDRLVFARIIHTLGSAVDTLGPDDQVPLGQVLPGLAEAMDEPTRTWAQAMGLSPDPSAPLAEWSERLASSAFGFLSRTIVSSAAPQPAHPVSAVRRDEIVWGRAPARLDLGGGWTDTPPYALEHGGCVVNAAVNLNGQPPIHCYARVTAEPVIRIGSIDLGTRIEVHTLEELLDYASATSDFALAKAALALSGLHPQAGGWPTDIDLPGMLELFGGGIELTTLAAIPKGSGLGTSSIVGSAILATVQRLMGRQLSRRELFHGVLRLEQALTTGGGWQDQVGGAVDGVKVVRSGPGLVPDIGVSYVPGDVLDPRRNGGCTLLYYTGITRLAKNILQQVVGRYLDRDRAAQATLARIHALPAHVADALARKDLGAFGEGIDAAWELNKRLDPNSTNQAVEDLLDRVRPHVYGAKLLGAGGGGFLLMVCKSPAESATVRRLLEADPPNDLARFFEFDISTEGLVVTAC